MGKNDDVANIKVGGDAVGVVGLKAALEDVAEKELTSDEEISSHLVKVLSARNYIAPKSEPDYARAFLREYKKFKGEPFEIDDPRELEVKILGPGCPNCEKLEQIVCKVMSASNIVGTVEHVRDLAEITSYGFVATPALVINGKVKSSGRLPPERQVLQWLEEADKAQ
jgi:hypothetical protein